MVRVLGRPARAGHDGDGARVACLRSLLLAACAWLAAGCGRLEKECHGVSVTANAFIAESERLRVGPAVTPEQTAEAELRTAARYEKLAGDLAALDVKSSELLPEVTRYRELAEHSAASLRAVAADLGRGDFEAARQKRVALDREARGEGPLVARINAICSAGRAAPGGR